MAHSLVPIGRSAALRDAAASRLDSRACCALATGRRCARAAGAKTRRRKRTAAGNPDISGIWEAISAATSDVEDHAATFGPVAASAPRAQSAGLRRMKARFLIYPPRSAQRDENYKNRLTADPEVKCYRAGVPRATYMPQPFQILQTDGDIVIAYQYASAFARSS